MRCDLVDCNGKIAFEYFDSEEIKNLFLLDVTFPLDALTSNNNSLWFQLVEITGIEGTEIKMLQYVERYPVLTFVKDGFGRLITDMATPNNKTAIRSVSLWFGRYRLSETSPEHVSSTCTVFKAIDEMRQDSNGNPLRVAIKLMRNREQFLKEVNTRSYGLSKEYIVTLLDYFPADLNVVSDAVKENEDEETEIERADGSDSNLVNSRPSMPCDDNDDDEKVIICKDPLISNDPLIGKALIGKAQAEKMYVLTFFANSCRFSIYTKFFHSCQFLPFFWHSLGTACPCLLPSETFGLLYSMRDLQAKTWM